MKYTITFLLLLIAHCFKAQVTLTVTVNSGSSITTCNDGFIFGIPQPIEPQWSIAVAGQGITTYPSRGGCHTNTPNTQYSEPFSCANSYPTALQVCLRAFEDDGNACVISESCLEQSCQNFLVPAPGTSVTYTISVSGTSSASVNFTITAAGSFISANNDSICNAINLGTLNSGNTIGNRSLSNYSNICATNTGEPSPWGGNNDQGVWFQFTTGPTPSSTINIDAISDPQVLGDPIDLQLALYESSNDSCTGVLTLIKEEYRGLGLQYNEEMALNCLKPNTTYFLLVDGEELVSPTGGGEGFFGLQVSDNAILQAADLICEAEDFGLIPNQGSVGTPLLRRSNLCATNSSDPNPTNWSSNNTVWFKFRAPSSGSVTVDANSDLPPPFGTDAIDLQLAIYETTNGLCTGALQHIKSNYTFGFLDEELEVRCLTPGEYYWLLLDGSSLNPTGIFDVTISDGGTSPAPNNLICNAKPLGNPGSGGTVGLLGEHNYCADNVSDPVPNNWGNDMGVWYTFLAPLSGKVEIRLDHQPLVDRIDLQVAIYESTGAVCTGTLTELKSQHDGAGLFLDEDMEIECLIPGREYWVLVDGEGSIIDPGLKEGVFNIEIYGDPRDSAAINNTACSALSLGDPTGGNVGTTAGPIHGSQNNYCAGVLLGEPQPRAFTADQTVWYTFVAPTSGAVNIDLTSDSVVGGVDPIDLQFAVYSNNSCSGFWTEEMSVDGIGFDVDADLFCLIPTDTYYVQVDGGPSVLNDEHQGYFDIRISEIAAIPNLANDDVCGAISLGNPWTGTVSAISQHNKCARYNPLDPVPAAFTPGKTVWYKATTPATGGPFALSINATSYQPIPFGLGAIDLQLAAFTSSDTTCSGNLTEVFSAYDPLTFNENMTLNCLLESTTYYIMVSGSAVDLDGYFDLSFTQVVSTVPTSTEVINACDSFLWRDGKTYYANDTSGQFFIYSSGLNTCDSLIRLDLTVNNPTSATDIQVACDSLVWIDGLTYTASNSTATYIIPNAVGCDSTITLNLTVNSATGATDTQVACDSLVWIDGLTYTASNTTATHIIPNAVGCDSTITLNLTVNNATRSTDTQVACDTLVWIDGITYTASNTTATHIIPNAVGCDSTITLNLTINNSTSATDTLVACDSLVWIDGITYTASNTIATHIIPNAVGCDSSITLNLTVNNATSATDTLVACDSLVWIDGITYTDSNTTATHIIPNAAGCDSTITLNLTIDTINLSVTQTGTMLTADEVGATYQWLNCQGTTPINGATNQTFVAPNNGNYSVIVSKNTCLDTSACYNVIGIGINENNFGTELLLYPNPTDESFAVDLGANYRNIVITITDLNGKLIQIEKHNEGRLVNLILREPAGMYLLIIQSGTEKAVLTLIKK